MSNEFDVNKQNLQDLLNVCVVLGQILQNKEVTQEEQERIDYCTKILLTVTEKQKFLNKKNKKK